MGTRMLQAAACWTALCAVSVGSASAAPPAQVVTDPRGGFAITIPPDWRIPFARAASDPSVVTVVEGPERGGFAATVTVQTKSLRNPYTPDGFAGQAADYRRGYFHGYTVTQEGDATIAGRPAHFVYFTWMPDAARTFYDLQVYFSDGLNGWIVTGFTLGDTQHVHDDFPVLLQIIGTFRVVPRPR